MYIVSSVLLPTTVEYTPVLITGQITSLNSRYFIAAVYVRGEGPPRDATSYV